MDAEALEKSRQHEKEKLRQEIMEELKQKYYLKPKSERLEVSDILDKYKSELLAIGGKTFPHNGYSQFESIKQALRKIICLRFGVQQLKDVPKEKYSQYREEMETFIIEYLKINRKD